MADQSKDPSTVIKQARLLQEPEFKDFCNKVLATLRLGDRGTECTNTLRRLFLLLAATRKRKRMPSELIDELKNVVCEPEQCSKRVRLLCAAILHEVTPTSQLLITNLDPPVDQRNIPIILPLVWVQGKQYGHWSDHVPQLLQWLTKTGTAPELQLLSLGSLQLLLHAQENLLSQEDTESISGQMANWLKNASTVSASNPYQRQIFGRGKSKGYQLVTEIDGTSTRYFFTVLSLAQYCFPDQILNIQSFSMLRSWLNHVKATSIGGLSPLGGHSPLLSATASKSGSIENLTDSSPECGSPSQNILNLSRTSLDNISIGSQSSTGFIIPVSNSPVWDTGNQFPTQYPVLGWSQEDCSSLDGESSRPQTPSSFPLQADSEESMEKLKTPQLRHGKHQRTLSAISFSKLFPSSPRSAKRGEQVLKEKACEYCLRLLEQSERKPSKTQDAILIEACLVEATYNLDVLCSMDKSLVPKLIEIIRRLYSRVNSDINKWKRVLIPVVQFLLNHGEAVVFDPEPACKTLFSPVLSAYFSNCSFSFDVISFCLENVEKLRSSTAILFKYFPNLLKILAWFPRTYLKEFMDLLPAMLNKDNVVEMFHALLDLPCLAAALCTYWSARVQANSGNTVVSSQSSVDAFLNPELKPLFSFILRADAGHGDTIDKLSTLHALLVDRAEHSRVIVSSQIAPVLLSGLFRIVLEEANEETLIRLFPGILERVGLLYPVPDYQQEIHKLLCEQLVRLCQTCPNLIVRYQQDIIDFVSGLKNLGPSKENFFVHLVWVIGEFASTAHDSKCTMQIIVQYFEALEALAYEIVTQTAPGKAAFSGRLVSVVMTTLAKLASRCQDVIQRAILCLSKVVRQKPELLSDPESYPDLLMRAQELINLLKLPNVAPVILSPDSEVHSGRWHRDTNSSHFLLLRTCDMFLTS